MSLLSWRKVEIISHLTPVQTLQIDRACAWKLVKDPQFWGFSLLESPTLPVPMDTLVTSVFSLGREEIEKQKAKERYMKMHLAGKTEQAKADLARLAIIRKQREEAARKKEEERKG